MHNVSGQRINAQKSSITFSSKTPRETKERVKSELGIPNEGGLGKYLGLPEHFGRKKKDLFTMIVDRIRQKAISYSSKLLSKAGKLTMIMSVLSSIPIYPMSCFKLPQSLYKRIQAVLTRFWWDTSPDKKKICWISWQKLSKTKKAGGIGIRDVESVNDALLAKQSWPLLNNPSCLLGRVLFGKYCHKASFSEVTAPTACSHGWRGLLIGRDLLLPHIGKAIGNGEDTSVWNDDWLSTNSQLRPFGPAKEDDMSLTVADLMISNSTEWDLLKINATLPELSAQILTIKPSLTGARDSLIWLPNQSGQYSSKSGYHIAAARASGDTPQNHNPLDLDWIKEIWHINIPHKLKIFMWNCTQEAIATGENLRRRGLTSNTECSHCGGLESTAHIMFLCPFAQATWNLAPLLQTLPTSDFASFSEGLKRGNKLTTLPPTALGLTPLVPWILWSLWFSRNKRLFENMILSPQDTLTKAISDAREWQDAQLEERTNLTIAYPNFRHNDTAPIPFTVCTDGAWNETTQMAGIGWVLTSSDTTPGPALHPMQGSSVEHYVSSPLIAEALAMRRALSQLQNTEITRLRLQSDSQVLIRALNSNHNIKEVQTLINDIRILGRSFECIKFCFIPRTENREADSLAKLALIQQSCND